MLVEVEPTLWLDPHQVVSLRGSQDGKMTKIHIRQDADSYYSVDRPLVEVVAALSVVTAQGAQTNVTIDLSKQPPWTPTFTPTDYSG